MSNKMADFQKIFDKYRYSPDVVIKSKTWFSQQVALMSKRSINERKLFSENKTVEKLKPGKLYLYYYDPKHKATLPWYDKFPLVFPYQADSNSFIGLNMHYLSYYYRIKLMTMLMKFSTNSKLNEKTQLMYSWQVLSSIAQHELVEQTIHKYLIDHVRSVFIEIPATDWYTALMLPVERFTKASKTQVWGNL